MSTPRIYLFGSSIEHPETRFGAKKEKVSLEEIFRTTKVTDEIPSENEVKEEMQAKKTHKSAKYFIKKILTKFQSTSGNPTPSAGDEASNSVSTKKKLNKVRLPPIFYIINYKRLVILYINTLSISLHSDDLWSNKLNPGFILKCTNMTSR